MRVPSARGPLSGTVFSWLRGQDGVDIQTAKTHYENATESDRIGDEDIQITLWTLYELHYGGFDDVDDTWEWSPECLQVRRWLERDFEGQLRESTADDVESVVTGTGDVPERLFRLVEEVAAPPLSAYLQRRATKAEVLEFLTHRSIYTLKEADPHTWAIPRLTGGPKVALVELQYDEYGAGRPARQHAKMFADALDACGLQSWYGAYIDSVPAPTLAVNNIMSMFGLHRRLRGAAVGHLAVTEATSSLPSRRVSMGFRRLALPAVAAAYFDEHIEADAIHEQLAMRTICGQLASDDPDMLDMIAFGAAACLHVDNRVAQFLLDAWGSDGSALREHDQLPEVIGA